MEKNHFWKNEALIRIKASSCLQSCNLFRKFYLFPGPNLSRRKFHSEKILIFRGKFFIQTEFKFFLWIFSLSFFVKFFLYIFVWFYFIFSGRRLKSWTYCRQSAQWNFWNFWQLTLKIELQLLDVIDLRNICILV